MKSLFHFTPLGSTVVAFVSGRSRISWSFRMRIYRVVPLGQDFAPLDADRPLLPLGTLDAGGVGGVVKDRPATQACVCAGRADEAQDRLVIPQRLAAPVGADLAEQPVLDRV